MVRLRSRTRGGRGRHLWLAVAVASGVLAAWAPASLAGPFVYVTNSGGDNVSQYDIRAGGLLAPLSPATVAAGSFPREVAVSPDGSSVYVTDFGGESNSVSQYDVRQDGRLSPKTPPSVPAGSTPNGLAVTPDGKSVYVANFSSGNVSQYNVDALGRLSPKTPRAVEAGDAPHDVAASPDGKSAYVTSEVGPVGQEVGVVFQYDVGAGGRLSPKNPASVLDGGTSNGVAVTPDGRSVYVASTTGDGVSQYDVGPGGRLSPKSPEFVPAGNGPLDVAVSPNGKSVYVTNQVADSGRGGTISQYDVGPGGMLAPKNPPSVATGGLASGIAIGPDGGSVYVASGLKNRVFQYDIESGGKLTPKGQPSVAAGSSPFGVAVNPVTKPPVRPGWAGWVHNRGSGCSARVGVPYLDANAEVTAFTEVFCPRSTQLTIRSRLRSDYPSTDVTVAQVGCLHGCVVSEPKGYRFFHLTCPKSGQRRLGQRYYSDIVLYPGTNAGAATRERSASRSLSPFCAR